jgi:recombination DNA repair RAD52 pathway protein
MTHTPTPLTDVQLKQLMTDLNSNRIASLKKGNTTLSYLETWDVKATLIRVFGFGGFSAEADECEVVRIENNVPKTTGWGKDKTTLPIEFDPDGQIKFGTANFRVNVRVRVKLTIHQLGAVYTEWAACSQTGPDLGEVTDFAIKTAESDALKRAAIYLGTQFGLSLYNDGATQDVVKAILAPGQEWSRGQRVYPEVAAVMGGIVNGQRPDTAAASVEHLRPEDVSDEKHQQNMAHLNSALSAQVKKKAEREAEGVDYAAVAATEQGVPAALEN